MLYNNLHPVPSFILSYLGRCIVHVYEIIRIGLCTELLELWSEGQRDVQRVQHGAVLQFVLSAQGLGDASSDVLRRALGRRRDVPGRQETAAASVHHHRVVFVGDRRRRLAVGQPPNGANGRGRSGGSLVRIRRSRQTVQRQWQQTAAVVPVDGRRDDCVGDNDTDDNNDHFHGWRKAAIATRRRRRRRRRR